MDNAKPKAQANDRIDDYRFSAALSSDLDCGGVVVVERLGHIECCDNFRPVPFVSKDICIV